MAAEFLRIKDIFLAAVDMAAPDERAAYLREACGGDAELRRQVDELLRRHEQAGSFLEPPPSDSRPTLDPPTGDGHPPGEPTPEIVGTRIGLYKLVQLLGEGGMGTVFLAEQSEPVQRQVALKIVKAGLDTAQVLARFELERQALALMDHPNIAKVFDAGTTPEGRPYFVMELIQGIPITRYCDQEHLPPRERLALFIPVCEAVQHAHQKGIIHRDLKPSNILIGVYDGKPVPKVIDFGVAKATAPNPAETSLFTEAGQIVGTLEYMAPEQAEPNNFDIDTRADIYSLGAILYELLAGSPPFTAKQLRGAAFGEMLRMIREVEPPKPSTKLSSSVDLPNIAAMRKLEPKRLTKLIHGDLDWIAMKCLEKDRGRRYETANALASELRRFLADEPVLAGPPGAGYRFKKFLQRNRGPVLAASVVVLALIGGIVGTSWGFLRAERARQDAVANEIKARAAADQERQANELAQKRLSQIVKANEVLASVFRDLDPNSEEMGGPTLRLQLRERLDQAARMLDGEAVGDPLTVARMQDLLGGALHQLGSFDKAVVVLEKARQTQEAALSSDDPDLLTTLHDLASAYRYAGRTGEAIQLFEAVRDRKEQRLGRDDVSTLNTIDSLALAYRAAGRTAEALPLFERVRNGYTAKLGPDHAETLTVLDNLASTYETAGRTGEAIQLLEHVRERKSATLGADHPSTLITLNNLANACSAAGRLADAIPLLEQVREKSVAKLGPDHLYTMISVSNLADVYQRAGRLGEAIQLFEQLRAREIKILAPDHPRLLITLNNLATAYGDAGRTTEATAMLEEARQRILKVHGADHPTTLAVVNNLATMYRNAGRTAEAVQLLEQVRDQKTKRLGPDHPSTLRTLHNLATTYKTDARLADAIRLYEQVRDQRTAKLGRNHPDTLLTMESLALALSENGQPDRAESVLLEVLAEREKKADRGSVAAAGTLHAVGFVLVRQEKWKEAESRLRQSESIRVKLEPDTWTTFDTKSLLGAALLGQKAFDRAEPYLVEGYEGMNQRRARIPVSEKPRVTDALKRLVQLYDDWGKPDQTARWRKELEANKLPVP